MRLFLDRGYDKTTREPKAAHECLARSGRLDKVKQGLYASGW